MAVARAIRCQVQQGQFQVGGRVPGTQLVASQHRVSLVTAHRALRKLVEEGLIEARPGVGTFVCEPGTRTLKVALVFQRDYDYPVITHPLLGRLCQGFLRAADVRRWSGDIRMFNINDAKKDERRFVSELVRGGLDGVLVDAMRSSHLALCELIASEMPAAAIGVAGHPDQVDFLAQDELGHMLLVVDHLLEQGARRIAFHRSSAKDVNGERTRAFLAAVRVRECEGDVITGDADACVDHLLSRRGAFDAVVFSVDSLAAQVRERLARHGVAIPRDLLAVGHDNWEKNGIGTPFLTTIDADLGGMAERALDVLARRILGPEPEGTAQEYHLGSLVIRQSSVRASKPKPVGKEE